MTLAFSKTDFAARLGVTKARISQLLGEGLPVRDDGRIDAMAGCGWVLENLTDRKAGPTRDNARVVMAQAYGWNVTVGVLARLPEAVALAAPSAGVHRDKVELLANFALLILASDINEDFAALDIPEVRLPQPGAWANGIAWDRLYEPDGAPRAAMALG